jgi:hypothetical protein
MQLHFAFIAVSRPPALVARMGAILTGGLGPVC